uniref:Retrovirus-related Env polyprotein from Fv-4 locus n=2 Tax=Mus musculus TaxID=10090 RepID=ENV2_MOUSE|nr:RecName: Full=Retrovirus-related Env polyprotein from Fv-4 locus [Mus musculus]AAA37564.1 envelope glycoprotein [Mus musculus]
MESPAFSKPLKDKTIKKALLGVLGILLVTGGLAHKDSPHLIYNLTWEVTNGEQETVWAVTGNHPLWTWWPDLTPDLCMLALHGPTHWGLDNRPPYSSPPGPPCCSGDKGAVSGCARDCDEPLTSYSPRCNTAWNRMKLAQVTHAPKEGFYVCPGSHRPRWARSCGGPEAYYCASWGCETTGRAAWKPTSSWDYITVSNNLSSPQAPKACKNNGWCNPLVVRFTGPGKRATSWTTGHEWGLRLYISGHDPGLTFGIRLRITDLGPRVPIGPNPVLSDQRPPSRPVPARPPPPSNSTPTGDPLTPPTGDPLTPTKPPQAGTGDRLLNLVQGAYLALNMTNPTKTQECWLCLVSEPPYYEGVAVLGDYTKHETAPTNCSSRAQHKLTLSEVTGQGKCLGAVPKTHQALCNHTEPTVSGSNYLVAPEGTLWACSTGLTPCLSTTVLNLTTDYCVLVELWPKVTYHPSEYVYTQFEPGVRFRREPVSLTLALLLGGLTMGGIAARVGTGTTALVATQQFQQLQAAMHNDLKAVEESITNLERSLTSLSEVVLQNRRGLDLLFLKEGGLCAALKEECCFYADHTGLVRDSMAKLRERLNQRQKLFESGQGWFEGLFNRSPWFTTLISTIMGPLIVLLLILLFGPCILNRLVQFVKDRISVVQALILTQQYHQLKSIDPEEVESRE